MWFVVVCGGLWWFVVFSATLIISAGFLKWNPGLILQDIIIYQYASESKQRVPGPKIIKLFSCSTQLSTKFILLINVKMPTIVGILTFISMISITSERHNARNFFICRYFNFYEQLKFCAQLS